MIYHNIVRVDSYLRYSILFVTLSTLNEITIIVVYNIFSASFEIVTVVRTSQWFTYGYDLLLPINIMIFCIRLCEHIQRFQLIILLNIRV